MRYIFLFLIFIIGCLPQTNTVTIEPYTLVDPFIGTGGHGHTFPGATLPFGMVQLSPDTRLDGWDGCGGYHYSDTKIYGFSHTHLSGTGVSDYGDILFMPTGVQVDFSSWTDSSNLAALYSHESERANPGYYSVQLQDALVELTASERVGFHRYTFGESVDPKIFLDLEHRDEVLFSELHILSNNSFSGVRRSKAWAEDQHVYFYAEVSQPFTLAQCNFEPPLRIGESIQGKDIKAVFHFEKSNAPLELKVAISAVDREGAKKNFYKEAVTTSFDQAHERAIKIWKEKLQKIEVFGGTQEQQRIFYTALYHTMIAPNLYMDVDGRYRDMDNTIHQSDDHTHYTVFSLWDTYRALHPLLTVMEPDLTNDFIKTALKKYASGGILPIWDLSANYTGCMIGYHGVSMIWDAFQKGIRDYDHKVALNAMMHSANQQHLGLESYNKLGFIPVEEESESVSKTLEYAYDDWCIAAMAQALGEEKTAEDFIARSQYYKNVIDPESKLMRGRIENTWFSPFDPKEVNFNYTEANGWQYSFYTVHDVQEYIRVTGGMGKLEERLDQLFSSKEAPTGRNQADITGLIGQYAHGNEPSHHIAYMYNAVSRPDKAQRYLGQILNNIYTDQPDGLSGNEDCGQMSAWYVWSALGLYPSCPGNGFYDTGVPLFDSVKWHFPNGRMATISKTGPKPKEGQAYFINGNSMKVLLSHTDLIQGGKFEFKAAGLSTIELNKTYPPADRICPAPYLDQATLVFDDSTLLAIGNIESDAQNYYSINGDLFKEYTEPIWIYNSSEVSVYSKFNEKESATLTSRFHKRDNSIDLVLNSEYANQYSAGGPKALIDGRKGNLDFRTGLWQGFQLEDLEATIVFEQPREIEQITMTFLQDQKSWIFMPTEVSFSFSNDGRTYQSPIVIKNEIEDNLEGSVIKDFIIKRNREEFKSIKIKAKNRGLVPDWHIGSGGGAWLFADEISIE